MKDLANKAASKFRRYKYTVGNSADLLYPAAGIQCAYTIDLKKLKKFSSNGNTH